MLCLNSFIIKTNEIILILRLLEAEIVWLYAYQSLSQVRILTFQKWLVDTSVICIQNQSNCAWCFTTFFAVSINFLNISRYFCEDGVSPLWEKWFHCEDLGTQLGPIIKE